MGLWIQYLWIIFIEGQAEVYFASEELSKQE
jgi:hypothetical protein